MMSRCCSDYRCKRKTPMRITRGFMSNEWAVVTQLSADGHSITRKHILPEEDQKKLNDMHEDYELIGELLLSDAVGGNREKIRELCGLPSKT